MELRDYLAPLRKWWWLIVGATLVAASASLGAAMLQPNVYRARTTLIIGQAISNPNPSGTEFWLTQQLAQTYAKIATLDNIRQDTMAALGLPFLPEYTVEVLEQTQLVEIEVTDTDRQRSQAVANELARQLTLQGPVSGGAADQSRQLFISEQLDDLETSIEQTKSDISAAQGELADASGARQITDLQNQIGALQNKLTTLQSSYAALLANTRQGAVNTLSVIEPAILPTRPIGPSTLMTVVVAAAIGFSLSSGAAYLLDYLDDTIDTADEIKRVVGLPTLAGIARINEDSQVGKLITLSHPRSPTAEAYRLLRTGVQFGAIDNSEHVALLITSANPSEGKSLTAANLAVVLAQAGHNVLIVDADLRRPTQHNLFKVSQRRGLTSFMLDFSLSGSEEERLTLLKRVIQPTQVEGLHLLPSGLVPPNPSELLGSSKMALTLETVRQHYDYVIVDSPPVLAVTDATILSSRVNGVVLVVNSLHTRPAQLKQAVALLNTGNAHLLGAVVNNLGPKSDGYKSFYLYRSTYYRQSSAEEAGQPAGPAGNGRAMTPARPAEDAPRRAGQTAESL